MIILHQVLTNSCHIQYRAFCYFHVIKVQRKNSKNILLFLKKFTLSVQAFTVGRSNIDHPFVCDQVLVVLRWLVVC